MRLLIPKLGMALLLLSIGEASAADKVKASFTWTAAQLSDLRISRDKRPIRLKDGKVELVFSDPRNKSEIEKILLDSQYRPGDSGAPDFFLETSITSPISKRKVKESSGCYWNGDPSRVSAKSVAVCSIEDDGGRVVVVTESRSDSLASSKFALLVLGMGGYSGFRIAADVPVANEQDGLHGIVVETKSGTPVRAAIKF
jgi:hypothetical protein